MDAPDIPPQAHFLYEGHFSKELDAFMLDALVLRKKWFQWRGLDIPGEVMLQLHKMMNSHYEVSFNLVEICNRLEFFQKRYKTFKALVHPKADTHWDFEHNKVTAHHKTWQKFFEADPFNMAYYYSGEPQIKKLLVLFRMDDEIKQEAGKSVIVISDSTEVVEVETGREEEACSEVNSPLTTEPRARRHLFSVSNENTYDEVSTTQPLEARYSGRHPNPSHYKSSSHESGAGDYGSYCASSDPYSPITSRMRKSK